MKSETKMRSTVKCCLALLLGALALSLAAAGCGPDSGQGAEEASVADLDSNQLAVTLRGLSAPDDSEEGAREATRRQLNVLERLLEELRPLLQPLFDLYGVPADVLVDGQLDESVWALLRDVQIQVRRGVVTLTNRQTGGVIFTGRFADLPQGTFNPANLPAGPGTPPAPACTYAYSAWGECQPDGAQTRTVTEATPAGCAGTPVLSQACTPAAPACSYTYSAWGACQSDGTQTRTVTDASPAGCAGTPVLSQACTFTAPACSYTYSAWGACQSDGTQTRTVTGTSPAGCAGTPVVSQACTFTAPACSFTYSAWGACQSNGTQTRTVTGSSPAGCAGTPALSQACTYTPPACSYTYSAWGACQSDGTQTRLVTGSSPAGCAGTPALSQACTYTPPACSYTYSAWGACQSNSTQTRTVTGSSPAGCAGTPVLSQACTYTPPTPACGTCHAIPPATGQHAKHVNSFGLSCATCHGTGYSKTTTNAATHLDGTTQVTPSTSFDGTSCANACHNSRTW